MSTAPVTAAPNLFSRGNYFAEGDYLRTDINKGVMRNRTGTRMIVLTDDFLKGLLTALTAECGPAAGAVLQTCGATWGRQYAQRFAQELEVHHSMPLRQFPMAIWQTYLIESFSHHGWGKLTLDLSRFGKGVLVATVKAAVMLSMDAKATADPLLTGVLAGFFSGLVGREVECLQTQYRPDSRFVLTIPQRLKTVADWPSKGKSHEEVVAHLEATRA